MQARKGTYTSFDKERPFMPVFSGFGGWVLSIFDVEVTPEGKLLQEEQQKAPETIVEKAPETTTQSLPPENNDTNTSQQ